MCSPSKLGLPLNFVAGVKLYFVEQAENGPASMLKPNPMKSRPVEASVSGRFILKRDLRHSPFDADIFSNLIFLVCLLHFYDFFSSVPCPPRKLELLRDCSSEVIIFSWEHTNNTDYYMAKAVDSQVL